MKEKIYRAGLIPYIRNEDDIEMLFMVPSNKKYGGNKYQIAKGKVEEDESNIDAAIREAKEELGFTTLNKKGDIRYIGRFLGRTDFYIVEVKNKDLFTKPHYETGNTKWLTLTEFLKIGRELHKPIVQAGIRLINKEI